MKNEASSRILDDETFEKAVLDYRERIFLVILRYVKNREDAKDLTQETFVKAYRSRNRFRGDANIYTWLYRIAINLSLNHKTRGHVSAFSSIEDAPEIVSDDSPADGVLKEEMAARVNAAIMALPPRQRMVFTLRYYDDKSHSEIAILMGITEGASKANYHQAIRKLRNLLNEYLQGDKR